VFNARENQSSNNHIVIAYSFETPIVKSVDIYGSIYDEVTIDGTSLSGNPGEPSLPAKGAYILLPQGKKVNEIVVTYDEVVSLGSGFNIRPVAERFPISDNNNKPMFVPDENIYFSTDIFPGELYTEVGTYNFRGYNILILKLNPVQYIPSCGELFYYPNLIVNVETENDAEYNSVYRGLEKDREEVMKKVDNPDVVDMYTSEPEFLPLDIQYHYDLVIITTEALKEYYVPLADAHNASGTITLIKTVEDIVNDPDYWVAGKWGDANPSNPFIKTPVTSGLSLFNDTQAKIRNFIRDAYANFGVDYVLLGGDADDNDGDINIVPVRELKYPRLYFEKIPSDLYYACIYGSFNSDCDKNFGEPNDGENGGDVNLFAEVYVGRACTDNAIEVQNFVSKTIAYMNSDSNDSYLKKVLLVGEFLGFGFGGLYMEELVNCSNKHGYKTIGFPTSEFDIDKMYGLWSPLTLIHKINNNVHIINHVGHSNQYINMKIRVPYFSLGVSPLYPKVNMIKNDKFCFIYSQGCMAGYFSFHRECIAEYFTIKTAHGAFAGIWNSRNGVGTDLTTNAPSQHYNREFWDAVFGENITVISKANQDSKEDNLWRINEDLMRYVYYELNLFGDPAVQFKYSGSSLFNSNSQTNQQQNIQQQNQQSDTQLSQNSSSNQPNEQLGGIAQQSATSSLQTNKI
jgi:hypothetical protein